jgi:hypothetical protein
MPKTQMDRETDLYTALGGVRWRLAQAAAALQAEEPSPDLLLAIGVDLDQTAERLDLLRQGLCPQCRPRVVTDRLALGSPGH